MAGIASVRDASGGANGIERPAPQEGRTFRVFFGGPGDIAEFRPFLEVLMDEADHLLSGLSQRRATVRGWMWCGQDNPTPLVFGEKGQDAIDRNLASWEADLLVVVFKDGLGTRPENDPARSGYESFTAYELQTALEKRATGDSRTDILVLRHEPNKVLEDRMLDQAAEADSRGDSTLWDAHRRLRQERKRLDRYLADLRSPEGATVPVSWFQDGRHLARTVRRFLSEKLRARLDETPARPSGATRVPAVPKPLPGLTALGFDDHDRFKGREVLVDELSKRLDRPQLRFLCLTGPSGAGKSSVMKAGLIGPRLAWQDGPPVCVLAFSPGANPFQSVAMAMHAPKLGPRLAGGPRLPDQTELHESLERACLRTGEGDQGRSQRVAERCEGSILTPLRTVYPGAMIYLVIDQMEELWTKDRSAGGQQREAFLRLLGSLVAHDDVRIVATLRSDIFPRFTELGLVTRTLFAGGRGDSVPVNAPVGEEIQAMATGLLKAARITFEDSLVVQLALDTRQAGSGALPLVAYTLWALADGAKGVPLTRTAYIAVGGLAGAVAHTVQRELTRRLPEAAAVDLRLPVLFRHLADLGDVGGVSLPVRRVGRLSRLLADGVSEEVLNALAAARVVQIGGDDVELAHDALFQEWAPLRDWVEENRGELAFRDQLKRDADAWRRHGRNARFLKPVGEARQQAAERPDLYSDQPLVKEYLAAAKRQSDKQDFIAAINNSRMETALDLWAEYPGGIDLDPLEDRGEELRQLRPAIYAAVTGDDRPDAVLFNRPAAQTAATPGEAAGEIGKKLADAPGHGSPEAEQPPSSIFEQGPTGADANLSAARKPAPSVFDEPGNLEVGTTGGWSPLHIAALFGREGLARSLLQRGIGAGVCTAGEANAAMAAAYAGHLSLLRMLCDEYKVDPLAKDKEGGSPIIWAFQRGHAHVVDDLIRRGARTDVQTDEGWSCLTEAARGGHLELVRRLIEHDHLDPDQKTKHGLTALVCAARGDKPRHVTTVGYLLNHMRDARAASTDGFTALHGAALVGSAEMVDLLISKGFDPNAVMDDGEAPLHLACRRGVRPVVEALLRSRDIDPNICNTAGVTPLALAAAHGHDRLVVPLVACGAERDRREGGGWSAICWAADEGDLAMLDMLIARASPRELNGRLASGRTAMMLAAGKGEAEALRALLQAGASARLRDRSGATALHLAAGAGRRDAVKVLLEGTRAPSGVIHLLGARDGSGRTALALAAERGDLGMVRDLLDAGADATGAVHGDYLVPELAGLPDPGPLRRALAAAEDPNMRDAQGLTALHIAAATGRVEACEALLAHPRIEVDARAWTDPEAVVQGAPVLPPGH